eukprot:TRINITY_DN4232_c0_g1_i1.p1 TRINITY_DN4232_c0_g1~~TRINITY_DN4232_c0_g1_i1.p1  ORF type:complete len:194 (+),score=22.75 TRINITY_DN4232_c0_g1_i1:40-621(+)
MSNLADSQNTRNIKIVVVGESGVGKTSLLKRYTEGTYSPNPTSTIDHGFKLKQTTDFEGKPVKLVIWDTAGQEKFRSVTASFFHGASGVILAFSITDLASFEKLNLWIDAVKAYSAPSTPVVLVGNKIDLSSERVVDKKQAVDYALQQSIEYLEASALDGTGVNESFETLTSKIFTKLRGGSASPKGGCCGIM